MNGLCTALLGDDDMCARPSNHDGDHSPTFDADEWPNDCDRCASPIPGQPAHNPSSGCVRAPTIIYHCPCPSCFGR